MKAADHPSSPDGFFDGGISHPLIVTVSGASKDVGKSSLASFLVKHLPGCAAVKVSVHRRRPPGEFVVEEGEPLRNPGTDTGRLYSAGARPVLWVRSTVETLQRDWEKVLERVDAPVLVVEGNSILRFLRPDFAVFVMGSTLQDFKPSAYTALAKAHTVVVEGGEGLKGEEVLELERRVKALNPRAKLVMVRELGRERAWGIVLSRMVGCIGGELVEQNVDPRILEAVREKAEEGRLPCAVALKLAEKLGVPPLEVGKAADALKVKITKCSLGCF